MVHRTCECVLRWRDRDAHPATTDMELERNGIDVPIRRLCGRPPQRRCAHHGGRVDPDPQAQGDETDTADVLIWDEMNGSWTASDQMMAQTHVWCAATFGAGKVFVVGDWSPESGEEFSQGRLSILDLQNDSWSIGPPLPSGREAGAVGVAFHEGLAVRCGGCHQPERIDATTHPDLLRSSDGGLDEPVGDECLQIRFPARLIRGPPLCDRRGIVQRHDISEPYRGAFDRGL